MKTEKYKINWEHEHTINNWVTDLHLVCEEDSVIDFIGSVNFIGAAIGAVLLLPLGDYLGRRKALLLGVSLEIVAWYGLIRPNGIEDIYFFSFCFSLVSIVRGTMTFMLVREISTSKDKMNYLSWINGSSGIYIIVSAI